MVDIDEAPPGYFALESPQNLCEVRTGSKIEQCAFYNVQGICMKGRKNADRSCSAHFRKDGANVIFIGRMFQTAHLQQLPQDTAIIDDFGLNSSIDGEHAPAGMVAKLATDGCQGCFYLKGKADCVRTAPISCTSLGRKDGANVIFVPR